MNELTRAAAESASGGWILGVVTVVFLAVFLIWAWMAYRPKNRGKWEEASRMPFMDGGDVEQRHQ